MFRKVDNKQDITQTLQDRGNNYGQFDDLAPIAQTLKAVLRGAPQWRDLQAHHKESLDMIMSKVARVLNGDPNYADNWHDIAGYATLVEDVIKKDEVANSPIFSFTNISRPYQDTPKCETVATDTDNCNTDDQTEYLPLPTVETFPWDEYEGYNHVRVDRYGNLFIYHDRPYIPGNGWEDSSSYLTRYVGDSYVCENWRTWGIDRPAVEINKKTETEADDLNNHIAPTTSVITISSGTVKHPCQGGCLHCVCKGGA